MFQCIGSGLNAKGCLYDRVIVPTVLHDVELWGMRLAGRRIVNVLEMKYLRIMILVTQINGDK